ncbi:MAG: HK97 gp10 family phage protein [Firmicutes bacterium]|nr:HK97 gp10 family phage protein [Bacillota bacterium]
MTDKDGTFGFEDLERAFKKTVSKFDSKSDAMLMAMTNVARARVRANTPTNRTNKLKGSWRTKKPKVYGKARVARIQSQNRYAHTVEEGHNIVSGGATVGRNGRRLNIVQQRVRGISVGGRTRPVKMIEKSMKELKSAFGKNAEKLLDELTREVQL